MGQYDLVLFLKKNKIYAMEVEHNGNSKKIGFHGEEYFLFNNSEDIDEFYKNISDTYNVDDLYELDASIYLIDCGIEPLMKWHFIEKAKLCINVNIISISCLLPILLSKKGLLKIGKQIIVEFLEEKYAYIYDDEYHVEELSAKGKTPQCQLSQNDFSFIAVWSGEFLCGINSVLDENLKTVQNKLEMENDDLKNKLEECTELCNSWKEKYKKLKEKFVETENIVPKYIADRRALIKAEVSQNSRIIRLHVQSGMDVKNKQQIASFKNKRESNIMGRHIYAPRDGKVVWLPINDEELPVGTNIIGVFGEVTDNPVEMREWLNKRIKK